MRAGLSSLTRGLSSIAMRLGLSLAVGALGTWLGGAPGLLLAGLAPGEHLVCEVALNDGSGRSTDIGCLTHVVADP